METGKMISKITGIVNRGNAGKIFDALASNNIVDGHLAAGRATVLQEKKGLLGGNEKTIISEDPIEIFSFLVSSEFEESALNLIIKTGGLDVPGRGMAFSEKVTLIKSHPICGENKPSSFKADAGFPLLSELSGICCIAQRGQGNAVARVALDTGTCVPAITFGTGTGVRDKLGILRIAIPAEKEVINIAVSKHDADAVMDLMVDVGKLDEPGKGFIYNYPLSMGIVNTKITRGMPKHAASIEQIISVIDAMKGGTEWRRRSGTAEGSDKNKRACLLNLLDLTLICDEGRADGLVKAAMSVGAAGATISKLKHICPQDSPLSKISLARESCSMIVSEAQIPVLCETLEKAGAFDDKTHSQLYYRPAPKACTYLGKK